MSKTQKPGPDSPGGPRVRATCEICDDVFWPRAVDIKAGHGRHCSDRCAMKEEVDVDCQDCGAQFRTRRYHPRQRCDACKKALALACERRRCCSACGAAIGRKNTIGKCGDCVRREIREVAYQRRAQIASGTKRKLTLGDLALLTGRPLSTVRYHRDVGNLGAAWDGTYFDLDHPGAAEFLDRRRRPRGASFDVECAECGAKKSVSPSQYAQSNGRVFCDRSCQHLAQVKLQPRKCPGCGEEFQPKEAARKTCSPRCAALVSSKNAPKYQAFGNTFTMKELVTASGLSASCITGRIKNGETLEQAITRLPDGRGGWQRKTKTPQP